MKRLVPLLTIALVVLSAGAIRLQLRVGEYRQHIVDLQTRLKSIEDHQHASAALADQAIANNRELTTSPTPTEPSQEIESGSGSSTALAQFAKKLGPVDRDVRRAQRRMRLPGMYPGLGRWLDLTPEQEKELFDLMAKLDVERENALWDPAKLRDEASRREAINELLSQSKAGEAELAALLGNKYPKFQEYKQTGTVHKQVSQLQGMFGSGADGLTDAQVASLTKALVAEKLRIDQEQSNLPHAVHGQDATDLIKQRIADNNQRLVQVAALQLSPRQLEGYRKLTEHQEGSEDALLGLVSDITAGAQAANP